MEKSLSAALGILLSWLVVGIACTPELSENTTAAANAVSVGSGTGNAGAGASGGGGAAGGAGGQGGAGIHGCDIATAVDRTGVANVLINDISPWTFNHSACVRVDAGTAVRWNGNFGSHPLNGGVTPVEDATSPINDDAVMNDGTTDFVEITFPNPGTFPYFCGVHVGNMTGVVFVEGAGGSGGSGGSGGGGGGSGGSGGAGGG